jgi:hypothetical protein
METTENEKNQANQKQVSTEKFMEYKDFEEFKGKIVKKIDDKMLMYADSNTIDLIGKLFNIFFIAYNIENNRIDVYGDTNTTKYYIHLIFKGLNHYELMTYKDLVFQEEKKYNEEDETIYNKIKSYKNSITRGGNPKKPTKQTRKSCHEKQKKTTRKNNKNRR